MEPSKRAAIVGYLGHDPELMNDTLENNILMGDVGDAGEYLRQVCLKGAPMPWRTDYRRRSEAAA